MRLWAARGDGQSVASEHEEFAPLADPLTGLYTEKYFGERINSLVELVADDESSFAVVIFDIDGFKPISDLFGRSAGDRILQQAGARLHSGAGPDCIVARIGPDEYGVIIPYVSGECETRERIQGMLDALSAPYDLKHRTARLSASAGCSLFKPYADTADTVFNKAQTALYHAKRRGQGQLVLYSVEMEKAAKKATRIEQALRRAIAADEVESHFQPIVDLSTRRIIGFEALARWTDPEIGVVMPATFIPIAEERGFIGQLAQNVLRKATLAARDWPEDVYLSFNLSPSQLVDQRTACQIQDILATTGFNPHRLEIEITETGLMTDPRSAAQIIEELRHYGMRIALDDFGTGQSSLGRLRDFRFDKLKIDRSFVSSMIEDQPSELIVRAIVALCEGLRLGVTAEGIEEEEQAQALMMLGCSEGQGYLFGSPMDAASALRMLGA